MKRLLVKTMYVCSILVALSGVAVAGNSDKVHYDNKEHGYSFDFQNNWTETRNPQDGFDVAFVNVPTDAALLNSTVLVACNTLPAEKTFDAAAEDFLVGFSKSFAEYKLEKKSNTKLGTGNAVRFESKATLNGKSVKLVAVATANGRTFVCLMMLTPTESNERDLKIFDEILLRSFKFSTSSGRTP
jgi:hypothetical protein